MPKIQKSKAVLSSRDLDELLRGANFHVRLVLGQLGVSGRKLTTLVAKSKNADFESGMYLAASHNMSLREKQEILAGEILKQIHICRNACRARRWGETIAAALLLGEARCALFVHAAEYSKRNRDQWRSAAAKNKKMARFLKAAEEIYSSYTASDLSAFKVESLWADVCKRERDRNRWCCGKSTFGKRWALRISSLAS